MPSLASSIWSWIWLSRYVLSVLVRSLLSRKYHWTSERIGASCCRWILKWWLVVEQALRSRSEGSWALSKERSVWILEMVYSASNNVYARSWPPCIVYNSSRTGCFSKYEGHEREVREFKKEKIGLTLLHSNTSLKDVFTLFWTWQTLLISEVLW